MARLLGLVLVLLGAMPAAAQTVRVDTSAVTLREVPADVVEGFRADPAYRYDLPVPQVDSWLARALDWIGDNLFGWLNDPRAGDAFEAFIYLLAAVVVGYALLRLLRMEAAHVFQRRSAAAPVALETLDENILEMDFDRLIDEAVAAQQFRRAVRLLYLRTLQHLADAGLIEWQRDKTNHAYIDELRRPALRPALAYLTGLFEYVWYGDFSVDEAAFGRVRHSFNRFDELL